MLAIALALKLEERLVNRTAAVAVVGKGNSGLAVARELAVRSYNVRMIDLDARRAAPARARSGRHSVPGVAAGANRIRRLGITADASAIGEAEVTVICVPVPAASRSLPETSHVIDAATRVAGQLHPGHLIVLRSVGYPGMTNNLVRPILESTGFRIGREIFLAFASRSSTDHSRRPGARTPEVVGGTDRISTRLGVRLMEEVHPRVVRVSSTTTAEVASLVVSAFRSVNFALLNQVTQLCHALGVSVWEIIDAMVTQRLNSTVFAPGLVDGYGLLTDSPHLAWPARPPGLPMELIELAERINDGMPTYLVDRLLTILQGGVSATGSFRILVLGISDSRSGEASDLSPTARVVGLLKRRHVDVMYHDPGLPRLRLEDFGEVLESCSLTVDVLRAADCVLLLGNRDAYDYEAIVRHARLVFDARNVTRELGFGREKIILL